MTNRERTSNSRQGPFRFTKQDRAMLKTAYIYAVAEEYGMPANFLMDIEFIETDKAMKIFRNTFQ